MSSSNPVAARRRVYQRDFKLHVVRQIVQGASAAKLAKELGVRPSVLGRWAREARVDPLHAFRGQGRRKPLLTMLRRLRHENAKLKAEQELYKKGIRLLSIKSDKAFYFIETHQTVWPVRWMCEIFDVSHSGYYDWVKRRRARVG